MGSTEQDWATEPIAITGLSCRLGGDATDAENLWNMLAEGRDAWSEIPASRFDLKGAYHDDPDRLGTVSLSLPNHESTIWLTDIDECQRRIFRQGGCGKV
jgi:hypothetical protein